MLITTGLGKGFYCSLVLFFASVSPLRERNRTGIHGWVMSPKDCRPRCLTGWFTYLGLLCLFLTLYTGPANPVTVPDPAGFRAHTVTPIPQAICGAKVQKVSPGVSRSAREGAFFLDITCNRLGQTSLAPSSFSNN